MPNVSFFGTVWETESDESLPLDLYLQEVRVGQWEDMVHTIRTRKDEKEKDKLKEKIPRVTFSGTFGTRTETGLVEHSGYIAIDLDDLEDVEATKKILSGDNYVYSAFVSTGGFGLTVLFRINGAKHRESFLGISQYLFVNYGLITDPGSIAVSKPFGVTFDPNIYINEKSTTLFKNYPKERKVERISNFAFAKDDFEVLMQQITKRQINLCENYDEWLKIGFALASKFGENGRVYYHMLSQISSKYNVRKTDRQYSYCLRAKSINLATIATFYWYCKEAGLQITSERTAKIKKATVNGKAAGLKKEQIIDNLLKFEGITDCKDIVEDIFDNKDNNGDGGDTLIEKLELFISTNYIIERNVITRYLESGGKDMEQRDLNSMFISAKKQLREVDYHLLERLLMSEFIFQYNPITRFFERLPQTKNIHLIDQLADTIINDRPEFTRYFIKKWLVSICSSAFGEHSPLVLVLVGEIQGTGKTEWFRRLLPKQLRRYYAESKLDAGKDDDILMTQKLIIMDDEMAGKSKMQVQKLKELTSKQTFSLREPYGRINVDLQRLAVLCGTSNYRTLLHDSTGNRRIIPIPVDDIDKDLYNSIDKEELFGEIFSLWKSGFNWRIQGKDDLDYLKRYEVDFQAENLEFELILKYFEPHENGEWVTSSEIKVELDKLTVQKLSLDMIGKQLAKIGFTKKSVRRGTSTMKAWGIKRINRGGFTPDETVDYF